ncbi:hypothetical protein BS47DRAFT_315735 [Hydnum rufescens UP504]|uniref:Uncharacterized protein n=1 Tax=Hydnum rufescens UP504 TaxID=1448309 RepID=A0A9P6AK36_9AGAM|nr:hypothetical protein BS47DRAFT_315735 [Hydnum rufescens UP504]
MSWGIGAHSVRTLQLCKSMPFCFCLAHIHLESVPIRYGFQHSAPPLQNWWTLAPSTLPSTTDLNVGHIPLCDECDSLFPRLHGYWLMSLCREGK